MAREPYRTRMLDALLSGPMVNQIRKVTEFLVDEAGSSHSDVVAMENAERLGLLIDGPVHTVYVAAIREGREAEERRRRQGMEFLERTGQTARRESAIEILHDRNRPYNDSMIEGLRDALKDPQWVPSRRTVEHLIRDREWVDAAFAQQD